MTDNAPKYECPDCQPDSQLEDMGDNVFVLRVHHDATCPTLAEINAKRDR